MARPIHRMGITRRTRCGADEPVSTTGHPATVTCQACLQADMTDVVAQRAAIDDAAARFRAGRQA